MKKKRVLRAWVVYTLVGIELLFFGYLGALILEIIIILSMIY